MKLWNVFLVAYGVWDLTFDKHQSEDLDEYISIQDSIIVLIFYDLLDLLLSEDSCK